MRPIHFLTALALILFASITIIYKTYILNISLLPVKALDLWRVEMSIDSKNMENARGSRDEKVYLPIPQDLTSQKVRSVEIKASDKLNKSIKKLVADKGTLAILESSLIEKEDRIAMFATVRALGNKSMYKETSKSVKLSQKERKAYLDISRINQNSLEELNKLTESLFHNSDSKILKLEKIFFFLSDEFVLTPDINDMEEALMLKSGSYLAQAKIINALGRLSKIPMRINFGVQLLGKNKKGEDKYTRVFFNEAYIGKKWVTLNPALKDMGVIPESLIILYRDITEELEIFNNRDFYSLRVEPLKFTFYDSDNYLKELTKIDSFWSKISLHRFPISIQTLFYTLLLIPFGTIILSIARNLIGVNTFGIFTPILLTLFFIETSLSIGLFFIIVVIFSGLLLRYILEKLELLAVPRLSIVLTSVIILYLIFAILVYRFDTFSDAHKALSYFPIVIITVFIERFSVYYTEEGPRNTFKTLLGTLIVSISTYFLFSVKTLKLLIFNHPELLLVVIGINILIGSYTGFRLTEFLRFAPLLKRGKIDKDEKVL